MIECPNCHSKIGEDSQFCSKCGSAVHPDLEGQPSFTKTMSTPGPKVKIGSLLAGKYQIQNEIGHGGMGIVYRAEDLKLKRPVALKFLPPEWAQDKEARERFLQEAQSAAALSHPNICTIYEVDESRDQPFIAMEYIEGETLREKTKRDPLPVEEALSLAAQAAEGLEAAHRKGIIHRDIKSANIMVTEKGQAKIMDFGLAKLRGGSSLTKEGTTIGTVAYMSPEQARGEKMDHRTDIWSLGVVLYEMLTGELPFHGEHDVSLLYSIVHEDPKSLKEKKPPVPSELLRVIERALDKNQDSRYQTAAEMRKDIGRYQDALKAEAAGVFNVRSLLKRLRRPVVAVPCAIGFIAIAVLAIWLFNRQAKIRWAKNVALPEIEKLLAKDDYVSAFKLAHQAEKEIPQDPDYIELASRIGGNLSVHTTPSGTNVFFRDYRDISGEWELIGQSPLDNVRVCRGYKRWKITMPGYEPVEGALMIESAKNIPHSAEAADLKIVLDKVGTIPSEMVRVHGDKFSPNLEFLKSAVMPALQLENYLLDRYEVTNRQFKEFIEAGGYRKPEFWKHKFVKDGRELTRDEAMKLLLDRTGRPGPAAWELGDYPQGEDDLPVAGISWYEAAAYAEFVSKSLPTVYHWNFALGNGEDADFIMHLSNFGGKGPTPVGKCNGMASCGIYDLAGNIKEWCWNETADRKRLILGGAWNENNDAMNRVDIRSPLSREANFGFRCMKLIKQDNTSQEAAKPVSIVEPATALLVELKPCSDEVFRIYKKLYDYNKTALNPTIEFTEDVNKYTRLEKVSFDTAYGDERMAAYLFIPRLGKPPFQTVIYYPGGGAWTNMSFFEYSSKDCADRLTKNGRAFVFPIIADTFERRMLPEKLKKTTELERSIMVVKDFMRTVDYLETRPELDVQKLAYEGISLGAVWGSVVPAIEARIKAAVLISGGLMQLPQECSQVNFAPRIKIPILMQNGEYDWGFRLETFQKPLFRLLGTLEKDKFHKIYEAGHDVWVKNEWIKDELDFLDKYLGPVK